MAVCRMQVAFESQLREMCVWGLVTYYLNKFIVWLSDVDAVPESAKSCKQDIKYPL